MPRTHPGRRLKRRRIPCGMRGLKWLLLIFLRGISQSHSLRNAWIEITVRSSGRTTEWSHSLRNAWIEIKGLVVSI